MIGYGSSLILKYYLSLLVQDNFILFLHSNRQIKQRMDLTTAITNFEKELQAIGFNGTDALLIQINIGGENYIRCSGNLNNLVGSQIPIREKHDSLVEFMSKEIAIATVRESTRCLHRDTLSLLADFSANIKLQEITSEYLQRLEIYMRVECQLSINTIARHMKTLKRYINVARKKGIITTYPFLNYTIKTEQSHRDALTEKELEKLEHYREKLKEPNETLNAFLFSCYTGLRYSDICAFTKQNIRTINRKKWIVLRMIKTNKEVRIPLSTIFEGKALKLTKSIARSRGLLFHMESNQQANRILKRIAKQIGIKKITFHTARHTCGTLLLYRGVSITTVQAILGHQSVKTTQIYSAVTDLTMEKELRKANRKNYRVGKREK